MVPMVARATQEVLALVPGALREASLALGVSRWRTVLGVVLPTALGGIVTGTVLAVARVAGETAPLLFTSSITANAINIERDRGAADDPGGDLHLLGVARSGRAGARVDVGARPDQLRARGERDRPRALARSRKKLTGQ